MHTLVIVLAVALGVVAVVALVLLLRLRSRTSREVEEQVAATMETLEARLDELTQELTSAVRRAEEETRRSRFLAQIGTTIDLDEALGSTLEAASALPRVDAAVVELDPTGDEEERLLGSVGFGDEGAVRIFTGAPDRRDPRAVELSYFYSDEEEAGAVLEALGVPLVTRGGRIGWLGVFSRDPETRFGEDDRRRLEELAERVAPAIENAHRFREARRLADLDALTGLHNRRYFHETLAREVARAHRYGRQLALVVFDLDDFKAINDRIGHLAGDSVLAETAERVRDVVRSADFACRVGGDELALILPESRLADAQRLATRIEQAVVARPVARAGHMRVSTGFAELQSNDDSTSLFERADQSLYASK